MNKTIHFYMGFLIFSLLFLTGGCDDSESSIVSFSDVTVIALDIDTDNPIVGATVTMIHYYNDVEHKIVKSTDS